MCELDDFFEANIQDIKESILLEQAQINSLKGSAQISYSKKNIIKSKQKELEKSQL